MDRPLPEKRDFDPGFPKGEWRHPEEEIRAQENEHMHFSSIRGWLESLFHPLPLHDDPAGFHPREDEFRPEFGHGFPNGGEGRQHRDEIGERVSICLFQKSRRSHLFLMPFLYSLNPQNFIQE
ncbi:hypothetical protein SUGI_0624530 [Cryptomeria japonica]|nr:hypothetical protein SUGI_0624530 [Cryptomeria japonica]